MSQKDTEPEDIVKLKPIMGIKPGVYLTALYSFILLLFLFWLLIYHGLVNHGVVLAVKTEPAGAAIRVNDIYLGTSGTKIVLPNSIKLNEQVKIDAVLPGFESAGGTYTIPGRVFGTRFFPRVFKLEFNLQTKDPVAVLAEAAYEFAEWTFGGEPTEAWQIPLVLSEAAYRIGTINNEQLAMSNEILLAASRFATTRAALRDLTRAKFLLDNDGNVPSPVSAIGSMQDILGFLSENEGTSEWLASLLPPENAKIVRESDWYKNQISNAEGAEGVSSKRRRGNTNSLILLGLSFIGDSDFLMSETPVTKTLFNAFLASNPEYNEHYFDYFEEEIARHPAQVFDDNIATGMSWYAAEAFCKWLTTRLPASYASYEVRLPTGNEWKLNQIDTPGWEWCVAPFAPLGFKANEDAIQAIGSPERTIIGSQTTSLPPDFKSPIVTFRPAIVRKQ